MCKRILFIFASLKHTDMIRTVVDTSEHSLLEKLNNLKIEKENIVSVFTKDEEIHVWYDDKRRL